MMKKWLPGLPGPHDAPSGQPRKEAWDELNQHLDLMASKADAILAEELERLVDDVCDEVRHRRR